MVTETAITESPEFEAYFQRRLPEHLREGAPPPASWPGSPERWAETAQRLHDEERSLALRVYAARLAKGWTPAELAGWVPAPLYEYPDGSPQRPPPLAYDSATMDRATSLIRQLAHSQAELNTILRGDLDRISHGQEVNAGRVETIFAAAESSISEAQRRQEAERQAERGKPVLRVHRAFQGRGSRWWTRGEYALEPEDADYFRELWPKLLASWSGKVPPAWAVDDSGRTRCPYELLEPVASA
jgi:hypothetical protein